tara:strand:+ start:1101 stop:1844 length:744 start_codon:yes stop_codon:yes gene_type:complete
MNPSKYVETGETRNYEIFISPVHQRDINNSGVKDVMKSIKEHGFISAISVRPSIEFPGKLESYDGQHTVNACKRLGCPVVYNVFKDVTNKAMISLNSQSRQWKLPDYLKFGVTDGIKDYAFLNRVYEDERIPLTALIMMYGGSYANKSFKELSWKALTIGRGNYILKYIKDFEKTYNIEHSRYARFLWGFGKVLDSGLYNHKRMMRQLSKCSQLLTKQANPQGYTDNIEMVYNYGLSDKNKVQFTQK